MKHIEKLRERDVEAASRRAAERLVARAADEGLVDVAFAFVPSPLGTLLVAATRVGLVQIAYPEGSPDTMLARLAAAVSPRILETPARLDVVRRQLDEYFGRRRRHFELPLDLRLAHGFTRRVLRATARIPYGGLATYADMAREAGSPRAVRAAGNALGDNPIAIVVPCHRVVRTGGALGGYGGGLDRKQVLLRLEGVLGREARVDLPPRGRP
jgi:methylated-DNA-[protein]-cysteine S-methyltransferase